MNEETGLSFIPAEGVDIEDADYNFTAIDFAVDDWRDNCCEWKVIGNVFDNPELLEACR